MSDREVEVTANTHQRKASAPALLSIVSPAYREAENLPELYGRIRAVMDGLSLDWEWVILDDHSPDQTFDVVRALAARDDRVKGLRLARNSGSHIALSCALNHARGDCVVALAADLQDPPETIPELLDRWREGAHVVWAARGKKGGESVTTTGLSRVYYWLMRRVVGFKEMPSEGADFFLLDRRVLEAFSRFNEKNVSILALITWMGFRQTTITYTKQERSQGKSGWTLRKKLKLLVDSVTSFSYVPIRAMSYLGFLVALGGFAYAAVVFYNALAGSPPEGWSALMVVVLLVGGTLMLMLGVLGEYVWRALDEAKDRPRFIVEDEVGVNPEVGSLRPDIP
ncbi:MAG: glycosyltransferase family 2 protein [Gemmatimonadota bacterium]